MSVISERQYSMAIAIICGGKNSSQGAYLGEYDSCVTRMGLQKGQEGGCLFAWFSFFIDQTIAD